MSEQNRKKSKGLFGTLLRFLISFGAIGIILYMFRAQLPAVISHLKDVDIRYFLLAVAMYIIGFIPVSYRLLLVLRVHDTRLSLMNAYYVNVIAIFFNSFLPSAAGGDMVKAYYIYKGSNGRVASFSAVVVDRLFGLVTMIGIGLAAIFLFEGALSSPKILSSVLMLAAFTGVLMVVIFNRGIVDFLCGLRIPLVPAILLEKLREIYQAMYQYRGHKNIIFSCVIMTILGQVAYVFTNFLLARSLSLDIPLGFFFFFIPIILIIHVAPSINAIGVREATYLFYLTGFTSADQALALSLLSSFFLIFVGILGGVIFAFRGGLPARPVNS